MFTCLEREIQKEQEKLISFYSILKLRNIDLVLSLYQKSYQY